ncbi:unnamed protein product [Schistocephalus solidus]|uniref:Secreted protein n=1 Tax=Schistocephalus solidus TaxID=70667 RepID=A0A183SIL6_SCHSO|nr:unnamed protein product [Schistocephalus solidus]
MDSINKLQKALRFSFLNCREPNRYVLLLLFHVPASTLSAASMHQMLTKLYKITLFAHRACNENADLQGYECYRHNLSVFLFFRLIIINNITVHIRTYQRATYPTLISRSRLAALLL